MPITSGSITVGTAATKIHNSYSMPGSLHVTNLDNTDTVFIGDSTVVANQGHGIPKSGSEDFVVYPSESFYAVSTKAGHAIAYLFITP